MKQILVVLALILVLISCSNNEEKSGKVADYEGTWDLTKISMPFINSNLIGPDIKWQESYVFNKDGSFTKTRIKGYNTTVASGTFIIKQIGNEKHLELNFSEESEIVGGCFGRLSEGLVLTAKGKLLNTWGACDGPSLEYEKI